jgi:hypothetical protein
LLKAPWHHTILQKNSLRNVIKNVFSIDLHHNLVQVQVEEGSDAKRNSFIIFKGRYSKSMGGIGAPEMTPEVIGEWND